MAKPKSLPLICVEEGGSAAGLSAAQHNWAKASGFAGQRGRLLAVPGRGRNDRRPSLRPRVIEDGRPNSLQVLPAAALEPALYRLEGAFGDPTLAALGFRLGAYRFDRYRKPETCPQLADLKGADMAEVDAPDRGRLPRPRSRQHARQRSRTRRLRR